MAKSERVGFACANWDSLGLLNASWRQIRSARMSTSEMKPLSSQNYELFLLAVRSNTLSSHIFIYLYIK